MVNDSILNNVDFKTKLTLEEQTIFKLLYEKLMYRINDEPCKIKWEETSSYSKYERWSLHDSDTFFYREITYRNPKTNKLEWHTFKKMDEYWTDKEIDKWFEKEFE